MTVGVGVAGLGRELDGDCLLGAALFLFGEVDEGTLVGVGERRLQLRVVARRPAAPTSRLAATTPSSLAVGLAGSRPGDAVP